jgi:nicotinamidase-related amidase
MKRNLHLLVIDPQNDFCDLPPAFLPGEFGQPTYARPALPVPGAHADMLRLAALVREGMQGWSNISVTLDSHHRFDVAHPQFWRTGDGGAVIPFTQITAAQVRAGQYVPRPPATLARVLAYLDKLEAAGRYQLMIWPVHCEIGSWGQNVHVALRDAYAHWEDAGWGMVNFVRKGENPWTEHYSAVMAEVPDADDPATQLRAGFIGQLAQADRLYIAGEAGSHCVRATTEHIVDNIGLQHVSKLVLLTDCISPVSGFETPYQDFLQAMRARGVQTALATDVLPEIRRNI